MATINIAELAIELDTDPRTARKFMRSITPAEGQPGKGGRWGIEKREVRSLKSKFAKFAAELAEKRASRDDAADDAPEVNDAPATIDD